MQSPFKLIIHVVIFSITLLIFNSCNKSRLKHRYKGDYFFTITFTGWYSHDAWLVYDSTYYGTYTHEGFGWVDFARDKVDSKLPPLKPNRVNIHTLKVSSHNVGNFTDPEIGFTTPQFTINDDGSLRGINNTVFIGWQAKFHDKDSITIEYFDYENGPNGKYIIKGVKM